MTKPITTATLAKSKQVFQKISTTARKYWVHLIHDSNTLLAWGATCGSQPALHATSHSIRIPISIYL